MSHTVELPENCTLVITRADRIGDVVISSSCLRAMRENFPKAKIYFIARHELKPLFSNHPAITDFLPLLSNRDQMGWRWLGSEMSLLAQTFRALQPDAIVHLQPDWSCYMAAQQAHIPARIGWAAFPWTLALTHALQDVRKEGRAHEGYYNFDLLQFLNIQEPETLQPKISPEEAAKKTLAQKLPRKVDETPFVVLNASTAHPGRRWPAERFAELGQWIVQDLGLRVVSIGQHAASREIFAALADSDRYAPLDGELNLAELAWLLDSARLLVSCDTGPAHIAAAMGCPQVMIFGRTEPAYGPTRWHALDERAFVVQANIQRRWWEPSRMLWRRGFKSITVSDIQKAVQETLAKG